MGHKHKTKNSGVQDNHELNSGDDLMHNCIDVNIKQPTQIKKNKFKISHGLSVEELLNVTRTDLSGITTDDSANLVVNLAQTDAPLKKEKKRLRENIHMECTEPDQFVTKQNDNNIEVVEILKRKKKKKINIIEDFPNNVNLTADSQTDNKAMSKMDKCEKNKSKKDKKKKRREIPTLSKNESDSKTMDSDAPCRSTPELEMKVNKKRKYDVDLQVNILDDPIVNAPDVEECKKSKICQSTKSLNVAEYHNISDYTESRRHKKHRKSEVAEKVFIVRNDVNSEQGEIVKKSKSSRKHHRCSEDVEGSTDNMKHHRCSEDVEGSTDNMKRSKRVKQDLHDSNDEHDNKFDEENSTKKKRKSKMKSTVAAEASSAYSQNPAICSVKETISQSKRTDSSIQHTDSTFKDQSSSNVSNLGQWKDAAIDGDERKLKFFRLMGGFKSTATPFVEKGCDSLVRNEFHMPASKFSSMAMAKRDVNKLNAALEGQFEKARDLMFTQQKGIGLGFAAPPEAGKKYIDTSAIKSKKFSN